ncbi:zinc transporter [Anaeramoeba flamelloides]|uniref:Zinc transporter n=1 Tax=Anaeramoeba flamelloides TaxID=1746091 RepID=A0AAV7ZNY7_9EUKA|nr:zinc transporter [Anaeramoeba flamelloides]
MFKRLISDKDSVRIFIFLILNIIFMFVEFLYAYLSNSLSLLSDAFHMLFDCASLFMGLIASYYLKFPPNEQFTYGYNRVEFLSGFGNSIFLICVSFIVVTEAIERFVTVHTIDTENLLLVSVLGLLINVVGIFLFDDRWNDKQQAVPSSQSQNQNQNQTKFKSQDQIQKQNQKQDQSLIKNHKTLELKATLEKSQKKPSNKSNNVFSNQIATKSPNNPIVLPGMNGTNENIEGIWFHVLSDALGSVAVVISTILVKKYGWYWIDPLCSIVISCFIFISVYPLSIRTSKVMKQYVPPSLSHGFNKAIADAKNVPGVIDISDSNIWVLSNTVLIGTIVCIVDEECDLQLTRKMVRSTIEKTHYFEPKNLTVQIQRQSKSLSLINDLNQRTEFGNDKEK